MAQFCFRGNDLCVALRLVGDPTSGPLVLQDKSVRLMSVSLADGLMQFSAVPSPTRMIVGVFKIPNPDKPQG